MARNVQLIQLVEDLRHEVRQSTVAGVGLDNLSALKHILVRTQEALYDKYDWPHLRVRPTTALAAGSRFYNVDATLNYERIERAYIKWNDMRPPLARGITPELFDIYDPTADERNDPVQRWDILWTGSVEQVEVWPLPATNEQVIQWVGIRKLRALVADADVCDLDGPMIVLHAAAEILQAKGAKDAQAKAGLATDRFNVLKGRVKGNSNQPLILGGGSSEPYRERLRAPR